MIEVRLGYCACMPLDCTTLNGKVIVLGRGHLGEREVRFRSINVGVDFHRESLYAARCHAFLDSDKSVTRIALMNVRRRRARSREIYESYQYDGRLLVYETRLVFTDPEQLVEPLCNLLEQPTPVRFLAWIRRITPLLPQRFA